MSCAASLALDNRLIPRAARVPPRSSGKHLLGGWTHGISLVWTNSAIKGSRAYHDLNVAGMRVHAALDATFSGPPWYEGCYRIEWVTASQRELVERLREWGYAVEWIDREPLARLGSDLDQREVGDAPIAFHPDEGCLDPVVYAPAMLLAARRCGRRLHLGPRVTAIETPGGRVRGGRVADGQQMPTDIVVSCAGGWINDPMRESGLPVPKAPTIGLLLFTPPATSTLRHVIANPLVRRRASRTITLSRRMAVSPWHRFWARPSRTRWHADESG